MWIRDVNSLVTLLLIYCCFMKGRRSPARFKWPLGAGPHALCYRASRVRVHGTFTAQQNFGEYMNPLCCPNVYSFGLRRVNYGQ